MTFLDRDKYGMYKQTVSAGPGPALMGADTLLGEDVVNHEEDDLGDIKEIMIDMRTGQVAYAVLSFGGLFGIGEKLFAVPWQALQLDTVNKRFVLNVDKDRLESAPGFDADAWPDMTDTTWATQIHTFYGTDPSRSGSMGTAMPGSMVGGTNLGAGASSMGAGHAGTTSGAASSGSSSGSSAVGGGSGAMSGSTRGGTGGSGTGSSGGTDI